MNKDEKAGLWSERIQEFQSSGQTCRDWCTEHQIPVSTMTYWIRKLKKAEIFSRQSDGTKRLISYTKLCKMCNTYLRNANSQRNPKHPSCSTPSTERHTRPNERQAERRNKRDKAHFIAQRLLFQTEKTIFASRTNTLKPIELHYFAISTYL